MNEVIGDLLDMAENGDFDVIVQGCNCFNTMGGGIAAQINKRFHSAYVEDCKTVSGDKSKLGNYTSVDINRPDGSTFTIINGYTQYGFGSQDDPPVDYDAIKSVFAKVKAGFTGKKIGYPLIGAGLAGGDWNIISKIIDTELTGCDHTVVKYGG